MMTTFRAIFESSQSCSAPRRAAGWRCAIIGIALALLGGCSSLRVAYGTGPQLAWWWLDGYFDLPAAQTQPVRAAIDDWFDWHRQSQLPEYAALLDGAQRQVLEPQTGASTCRLWTQVRERIAPALTRALNQGAEFVPLLGDAQFQQLESHYEKNLRKMRDEYLQADRAERQRAAIKRTVERAEQLYGRLTETQRTLVEERIAASPFDPEAWLTERRARQRDTVTTLKRLVADKPDREQRVATLRTLWQRTERSPDPAYRAYQHKLLEYNCDFAARLHNSTSAAQRAAARSKLQGWEEDLRALHARAPESSTP